MSKPPKTIARNLSLTVHALGARGDGLADYDGQTVYIDGALDGEVVVSDITKGHDGILRGFAKQVTAAAPHRVTPPCVHAAQCGGCSLQHIDHDFYKAWKIERVRTALSYARVEAQQWQEPVFIPAHTRRRSNFTVMRRDKDVWIGYRQKRSHQIVRLESCLILDEALFARAQGLKPYLHRMIQDNHPANLFIQMTQSGLDVVITGPVGRKGEPDLSVHEAAGEMLHAFGGDSQDFGGGVARIGWRAKDRDRVEVLLQARPVTQDFSGLRVDLPIMAFLQPSREGENALVQAVMDFAPAKAAKAARIADLFSGCGTFSGPLLARGAVEAFEGDAAATAALKTAAQLRGHSIGSAEAPLTAHHRDLFRDPPRAGAVAQAKMIAGTHDLRSLTYVSCNPATFARDVAIMAQGGWVLSVTRPIDQFLWSDHIEIVAHLTRA